MKTRTLKADDLPFIGSCLNEGIRPDYLARYTYGITTSDLRGSLRCWGVTLKQLKEKYKTRKLEPFQGG